MKKINSRWMLALAGLLICGVVFAQSTNGNSATAGNDNESGSVKGQMSGCVDVETQLQARTQTMTANKNEALEKYEQIQVRLTSVASQLEEDGYDVDELQADIVTFDGMIAEFDQDSQAFMAQLSYSKQYACGRSENEFNAKMETTRTRLRAMYQDCLDLKYYWEGTLKTDLQELETAVEASETEGSL